MEFCYTLASSTRYIKLSDNGKCAFRVDYVQYETPDTYNNGVTYTWSGPGIVGPNNMQSIIGFSSGVIAMRRTPIVVSI